MATTPTNNAVPSESPRDLKFNAGKIDEAVNSSLDAYSDRFGKARLTWKGIEKISLEAISKYGYITVDSFEDGATLTVPSQVLRFRSNGEYYRWDGSYPKSIPAGSTPSSAGGIGQGAWLSVGSATLSSTQDGSGDALIAVKQPYDYAVPRNQHQKNADILTPADFGVDMSGANDSTAEFGHFLSAIQKSGTTGYLPRGKIKISDGYKITAPITLKGDKACTIYNTNTNLSKPIFDFTNAAASSLMLDGFTIFSEYTTNTEAVGIRIEGGTDFIVQNIRIIQTYCGVNITKAQLGSCIRGCFVSNTSGPAYHITDANLVVDGNYAINTKTYGFVFDVVNGAAGLMVLNNTNAASEDIGYLLQGSPTAPMTDVQLCNNLSSTTPNSHAFYFDTYGKNIIVANCLSELAGTNGTGIPNKNRCGFFFTNNNRRLTVSNCHSTFSGGSGMDIRCGYFTIVGGDYTANALLNGGSDAGILIGAGGPVTDFAITGVNTSPYTPGDVNYQSFGINLFGSGHKNGCVIGNVLAGTSSPLNISGSPTVLVGYNGGRVNKAFGSVQINSGSQTATVTHGLTGVPTNVQIQVANSNNYGFVGSVNATTFSVTLNALAASNATIYWEAELQ